MEIMDKKDYLPLKSPLFFATHDALIEDIKSGLCFKDAAENNGVSERQFYGWRCDCEKFREGTTAARIEGKRRVVNVLENSLFRVAMGYEYEERKEVTRLLKNGSTETTTEVVKKQLPPNVTALVFSLCNLAPERWKNLRNVEVESDKAGSISIQFGGGNSDIKSELEKLAGDDKSGKKK